MQRFAFRKIFNQFSHISYLLVIRFTTKFELQKSNYFCGFNINASEKENDSFSTPPPFSLSLSLHVINYYVIYNGSLFSEAFIFYGFKFIVECKTSF